MTNFRKLQDFFQFLFRKGHFHRGRQLTILAGISLEFFMIWEVQSFRSETTSKQNYKTQLMEIIVNCENVFFKGTIDSCN